MRKWSLLLGGLTIWAAHFFLLYGFASIFPGSRLANILTLIVTVPALAANAVLGWTAWTGALIANADELDKWVLKVASAGAALSFVAILWQALPAVIS
ncbi:MAG: hypothetical protein ACR2JJ_01790 [Sphingomicrobium sp.]